MSRNDVYLTNVRVKFRGGDWGVYGFPNRRLAELFVADIPRMQVLLAEVPELDNGLDYEWREIVAAIIAPTTICAN